MESSSARINSNYGASFLFWKELAITILSTNWFGNHHWYAWAWAMWTSQGVCFLESGLSFSMSRRGSMRPARKKLDKVVSKQTGIWIFNVLLHIACAMVRTSLHKHEFCISIKFWMSFAIASLSASRHDQSVTTRTRVFHQWKFAYTFCMVLVSKIVIFTRFNSLNHCSCDSRSALSNSVGQNIKICVMTSYVAALLLENACQGDTALWLLNWTD